MEIAVNMSVEEFQEFVAWKADREKYTKEVERLRQVPGFMVHSLRFAVEPVAGKEGRYKIVSQEHMADVMDMVEDFAPKK